MPLERRSDAEVELHRRLVWLTLFRLAVVLVLFLASIIRGSADPTADLAFKLAGLCAGGFFATLMFALLLRRMRGLTAIAYAEISFDALLATALVYLTGGSNAFSFVYVLSVVSAALVLSQRGAVLAATLSSVLFAALRVGLNEGWVAPPAPYLSEPRQPTASLAFVVFVNLGGLFLMAALASYLADQIRKKSEQLTARELDFSALAELHSAMLASISSGIATADPGGRLLFVNRAGWEICAPWRERRGELMVSDLLPGLNLPAAQTTAVRQELEIAGADGEHRFLGLTVSQLHGGGAFAGGHVIVFQDLTELRRLELEARRNERLASLGKLAAGLAHELRNPLASMSGAVQMLTAHRTEDADEQRLGDIVVSETDRLNRLVSDFLGFARPSPSRPARLELGELVNQTLDIVAHGPRFEGVRLERVISPVEVVADGAQLRQVVWNLAVNAAEAMDGKGTLTVVVETAGDEAVLRMDDSGPGLRATDLAQLFDPFFTTKPQGTGLGLATVHALVEAHRGTVQAENREAGGARFTVRLPRAPAAAEAAAPLNGSSPAEVAR